MLPPHDALVRCSAHRNPALCTPIYNANCTANCTCTAICTANRTVHSTANCPLCPVALFVSRAASTCAVSVQLVGRTCSWSNGTAATAAARLALYWQVRYHVCLGAVLCLCMRVCVCDGGATSFLCNITLVGRPTLCDITLVPHRPRAASCVCHITHVQHHTCTTSHM